MLVRPLALLLLAARALSAQGLPASTPASAGLSPAGLARLDSAMKALVAEQKLPGIVVAVARNGRVAHWKAFGNRVVNPADPMERTDLFRIHSMTKPIVTTGLMILVEEGKVRLEDPVSKYVPEFGAVKVWTPTGLVEPNRPITVRDLLRHTSGLTYGFFGATHVDSLYLKEQPSEKAKDLADLMTRLAALPLLAQPGTVFNYGFSTDVVGRVIEVASGMTLDRYLAARVLGPLKMPDTFFEVPAEKRSRFTGYYAKPATGWFLADSPDSGTYTKPAKVLSGGGGLVSSTPDYLRFMQMILNGGELDGARILSRKSVAAMLRNQLPGEAVPISFAANDTIRVVGFGLGFAVVVDAENRSMGSVGNASWGGYANTFFFVDPKEKLSAVVMTQFFPFAAHDLDGIFRRLVYKALN
jgi:CubicO group peptidase (beta-lactamase class C family)